MNYTLNQLRVFKTIVDTGSITRAAEALNLTQPAISIQLKNFQREFDSPLTETLHKKLYITEYGREVAAAAETLLQVAETLGKTSAQSEDRLIGKLRISVVSTGKYVIPYFLTDFLKQHPRVELVLDVSNKQGVARDLQSNTVDLSLVSTMPRNMELESLALLKNELVLVGSKHLALPKTRSQHDLLRKLTLIFREEGSATHSAMQDFLDSNELVVHRKIQLTSNEAVKQAVMAGLGVSILPLIGIRRELERGDLQVIPMKGLPLKSTWRLVWHRDKKHSIVAAAFLAYVRERKTEIVERWFG
jgi:DNA-binding transcriptional LysR family regulator